MLGRQKRANLKIWAADDLGVQPLVESMSEAISHVGRQVLDIGCGHRSIA